VPEPIVIDTDPGQDDAVALLLALAAADRLEVRGITTVAGNAPIAQTTANALRIAELAGRPDVPVHAGCEAPLVYPLETAEFVCGPDGLAGAGLPPARGAPAPGHAVEFLGRAVRAAPAEGLTLCALGPLTNLALALRLAPDLRARIRRIVLMGGAIALGNITPAAEFNFYADPHAAAVVLGAGRPLTLLGLDVTHQAVAMPAHLAAIAGFGTATGRTVHGMLTRPRPARLGTEGHPLHDPCVIAYLLWPELFSGRDCFVEVEPGPGPLRGRSTIDWHGRTGRPANARVIDRVDAAAFFERLIATLSRLP
jgi:purine nucleosidase